MAKVKRAESVIAHVLKHNEPALKMVEKFSFVRETDIYLNSYGDKRENVGWQYRLTLK